MHNRLFKLENQPLQHPSLFKAKFTLLTEEKKKKNLIPLSS